MQKHARNKQKNSRTYMRIHKNACKYVIYLYFHVFWVSGLIFWVSRLVFWLSGLVFWVSGFIFWVARAGTGPGPGQDQA